MAVFALALVPTLSRLLAAGTGNSAWAEICTPQGTRLLAAADDGQAAGKAQGGNHLDHCPLCGLSGDAPLPPAAANAVTMTAPQMLLPRLFLDAPRPLFAWAAAQPRAPPARA